jgi:hypothetical protein
LLQYVWPEPAAFVTAAALPTVQHELPSACALCAANINFPTPSANKVNGFWHSVLTRAQSQTKCLRRKENLCVRRRRR